MNRCAWLRKGDALTMVRYLRNDLNLLGYELLGMAAILAFRLLTGPSLTGRLQGIQNVKATDPTPGKVKLAAKRLGRVDSDEQGLRAKAFSSAVRRVSASSENRRLLLW